MIREMDLASYLPEFMREYREPAAALEAENPEFDLVWQAADRVLYNRFISTADEYGISRFEKILNIYPDDTDELETRRLRVFNRWFNAIPYTVRTMTEKIRELLGSDCNFTITGDFREGYLLTVTVYTVRIQSEQELKYLLYTIVPLNIVVEAVYEIGLAGQIYCGGVVCEADIIELKQREEILWHGRD